MSNAATIEVIAEDALASFRHAREKTSSTGWVGRMAVGFFSRFWSYPLRRCTVRLARHVASLHGAISMVKHLENHDRELDPDLVIRHVLDDIKTDARQTLAEVDKACRTVEADADFAKTPLANEIRRLRSVLTDSIVAADQLQWELGEHDANFSGREAGLQAGTVEEFNAMMDRIVTSAHGK